MKIERLKKSHKKEIIIGGLVVLGIISAITLTTSRANYKLTQSIPIVRGTVNYKPYDFKVMAMYKQKEGSTCTEDNCYDEINEVPSEGYAVNEDKSICKVGNSETKEEGITISYHDGVIGIDNILKKDTKCSLYFDKYEEITSEEVLAKLNITNYKTTAPSFKTVATADEGIFRESDGMYGGYSYYWRGAATTNHLIFAEYCWRIVRINGDGTIRLIYNGLKLTGDKCTGNGSNKDSIAVTNQMYSGTRLFDNPSYVGWTYIVNNQRPANNAAATESMAKVGTDNWYNKTSGIGSNSTYSAKVADGKFCNDRDVTSGTWSTIGSGIKYGAYTRLYNTNKEPTLNCPEGDIYTLRTGAITADEVSYAGGVYNLANSSFYLYNGQSYWTMSPSFMYYDNMMGYQVQGYYLSSDGKLVYAHVGNPFGLRPVINLKANTTFQSGGLGTSDKPYIVQ